VNIVVLHVHAWDPEGTHAIAAPGLAPEERVVVWYGLPPPDAPEHPGLAPVVLAGQIDHHMAYAERLTPGAMLPRLRLHASALAAVRAKVLEALGVLHAAGMVHGAIREDRVWVGTAGEVILFGRGRWGGTPEDDLASVRRLFPTEEPPLSDAALARRVNARITEGTVVPVIEQLALTVGTETDDAADEVVPDIGPDPGRDGILDRWAVNTSTSTGNSDVNEPTPEITADGRGPTARLHQEFWQNLANPLPSPPPADRFAAVEGQPSRALRALVADEAPEPLPGRVDLPEPSAPQDLEDVPTMVRRRQGLAPAVLPKPPAPPTGFPLGTAIAVLAFLVFTAILLVHSLR
jgi:hypothetical protein